MDVSLIGFLHPRLLFLTLKAGTSPPEEPRRVKERETGKKLGCSIAVKPTTDRDQIPP